MREPFIILRPEITRENAFTLMQWLNDDEVRKYLSDSDDVSADIERVVSRVNLPVLTHLFCSGGRFFMACNKEKIPVGFVRLISKSNETEIVVVIGDRSNWGKGLGSNTIMESLKIAFFELRTQRVVARIHKENNRSIRAFMNAGFKLRSESASMKSFSITMQEYLESIRKRVIVSDVIYITEIDRDRLIKIVGDELKSGTNERTVKDLQLEISRARVVKPHELPCGVVTMNSRALLDLNNDEVEVCLAYPPDSGRAGRQLSILTPAGTAILGYSAGDKIQWDMPSGTAHIRIKKLLYQPEAAGHYYI